MRVPPGGTPATRPTHDAGAASGMTPRPEPVPLSNVPTGTGDLAAWVDASLGNRNGWLEDGELAAFAGRYGGDRSYQNSIVALAQRMGLEVASAGGAISVVAHQAGAAVGAAVGATAGTSAAGAAQQAAARALVDVVGSGTEEDAQVVARELARLPAAVLAWIGRAGGRVRVCRDSVTDGAPALASASPRGWGALGSFHDVRGVYEPRRKATTIATVEGPSGRALHRANTVLHEVGHMLDHLGGTPSRSQAFRSAYEWDQAALERQGEAYLLQPGEAGLEEAFAEMAARYLREPLLLESQFPNFFSYFQWAEENSFSPLGLP